MYDVQLPFIAGCSHFTRKKRYVLCTGFLSNTSAMQHSCSHCNAFCSITWQTRMYLPRRQQNMTTSTRKIPLRSATERPKHHSPPHTRRTTHSKTCPRNQSHAKMNCPYPPGTRAALHHWLQLFHTEKHNVSRSRVLPNTSHRQHSCS